MANLITLGRLPLLLIIVLLLAADAPPARLVTVGLLPLLIAMDSLDGIVARRRHEVSLLGSVLDIMVDRAVELVLWVCFAFYRLIPLAIPIIYVLRGTVVDSLRSMHVGAGQAPFKAMRTPLGSWLVGSPVMRSSYGVVKLLSFTGLALAHALRAYAERGAVAWPAARTTMLVFNVTSWIAVVLCLVRGVPVVVEAFLHSRRSA
ncbi:MAG: CDP-alcohol phosphatidyltransferase family protein [Anaerolineae bacterium]|nr:CDP-alcohol phosphatidyltransferase family protein [Anaerolineae bacterium]